ncbi:CBS domain-containing protein [Sphingomicrobium astaxanthinifaciens]|uniref:CBS domain-containing protein n=1 Tax=Sphingomicrobium astaxanthinifaciens TaxID=1227949 RepID=UPI001FCAFAB9|nr:CBS domain-containing protein [Sphingomicrobium astaxanthinifaciens]MCJ7421066.1 CBS domain-containing protein [Sphingomicrobium astaxanthinifaciens]
MTIAAILEAKGADVVTVTADTPVEAAARLLGERRIGALVVLDAAGEIAGICSERDVVTNLGVAGEALLGWPVERIMTAPATTVGRDERVEVVLGLMTRRRIRHLPVVESGAMVGIVSIGDLVKYQIDQLAAEAAMMRDYIQEA